MFPRSSFAPAGEAWTMGVAAGERLLLRTVKGLSGVGSGARLKPSTLTLTQQLPSLSQCGLSRCGKPVQLALYDVTPQSMHWTMSIGPLPPLPMHEEAKRWWLPASSGSHYPVVKGAWLEHICSYFISVWVLLYSWGCGQSCLSIHTLFRLTHVQVARG